LRARELRRLHQYCEVTPVEVNHETIQSS
jgi:hypothetical protein